MSRKNKRRHAGEVVSAVTDKAVALPESIGLGYGGTLGEAMGSQVRGVSPAEGPIREAVADALAPPRLVVTEELLSASDVSAHVVAALKEACDAWCARLVTHDSLRWSCACGASGRVGRSKDGIPYVDADILAHVAGEQRS